MNRLRPGVFALALMLGAPVALHAASLGTLSLHSAFGQPLNAEIDLRAAGKAERITARLASPEAYRQASLDYSAALAGMRVSVQKRPNGETYLRVVTPAPLQEPVINLLIEMRSGAARGVAQYTLLLDPPGYRPALGTPAPDETTPVARTSPPPASAAVREPVTAAAPRAIEAPPAPPPPAAAPERAPVVAEPPPPPAPALALARPSESFPAPAATAEAALESPRFSIARYEVEGAARLRPEVLERTLREFTGPAKDFSTIQSAVAAVEQAYATAGYGATRVVIPEQDIEDGVVRLKLIEAKVGSVEVSGNKVYSEANIRRSLPALREGEAPNVERVGMALRLSNETTTKHTQVTFTQSPTPGVVNAAVRVVDAPTRRWAASLDNTGSEQTGRWRTGLSYQDTNVWDRDHLLALQYVTSPAHIGDVAILGASYRIPLYSLGGALEAAVGHSNVDSGSVNTPAGTYGIRGSGGSAGLHYIHLLPRLGAWDQRVTAGLDYRYYKNDVSLQGGAPGSLIPDFETLPFSVTYSGSLRDAPTEWVASLSVVHNLPRGAHGSTAAFQAPGGRANANAAYTLVRYGVEASRALPRDWRMRAAWNGQQTSHALIPGEQFALGGIDSVRGFGERAISNDRGDRFSVELYTPQLAPAAVNMQGRALAFIDGGVVRRNDALPAEITRSSVSSAGLGLRVSFANAAHLRLDTAFVLDGDAAVSRGSNRTHARLIYLF